MKESELLVIKRGYDFSKWLLEHTGKFPKSYRFSIAAKMENAVLDFIELCTIANMRREKVPVLQKAGEALARLRLLFRLSYELRLEVLRIWRCQFAVAHLAVYCYCHCCLLPVSDMKEHLPEDRQSVFRCYNTGSLDREH
jgi:hypothetical protein